jgi:membrane protease YdiL (CAAX protease family)
MAGWLAGYVLLFAIVAFAEEVALRGFVLQTFARYGPMSAMMISSVITSLFHGANPHVNAIGFFSMFLSGVLFSWLYLTSNSLWIPIGLHWGWNVFLGPVCGFTVSGFKIQGLLTSSVIQDKAVWTGGSFGPEGGLFGLIAIVVLLAALIMPGVVKERMRKLRGQSA